MNVTPASSELRTVESLLGLEAPWNGKIVNDNILLAFEVVVGYWAVLILASLGVVTNSLVMIVFLRQGFRDSVNVSLFSIAVWDQVKCLAGVVYRFDRPLGLVNPVWGVNWRWMTWQYLVYMPIFSGYVSYALATYVSVERCLSVSIPFKVKSLITPRLTSSFMIVLSLVVFGSFSAVFFIYSVEYTHSPVYNASVASVILNNLFYAHGEFISKMYKFLGIFYPAVFCTIMITTSAIIVFHLKRSAHAFDRGQSVNSSSAVVAVGDASRASANMTSREVKVTKMLLVIIFIYLMDFVPRLSLYVASFIEPEFYAFRKYHNLMVVTSNFVWILDFINASGNFFIFMAMSTNFRKTFYEIYPSCEPKEKEQP
ncbi:peptide receptor GPCR [Elysia marginata]|uniref:Peptide receptor GPCR n=1 Tax=Elysia marginata TaxID=1093978 RepID=A0AAV4HUQ1_9GAST|nr:peptide receptor GPCR [Elysia marginata]